MFVVVPTLYFKGSNRVTARNRITVKKTTDFLKILISFSKSNNSKAYKIIERKTLWVGTSTNTFL